MKIKVSIQGNIIEVTQMSGVGHGVAIVKVDSDHYVSLDSGELMEFNHSESRADSKQSLFRTFRKIRAYINTNFTGDKSERFITLTYAENMTDSARLYNDFKLFWRRFSRKYGKAEYFLVVEPQERGAWHVHLLVKFPVVAPFIPNDDLRSLWGHGFVNVRQLDNVDNIGAYLSAYLADAEVPLESGKGEVKTFADGTKKRYVKGGRLHMYPPGMNIYRCSRGISKPEEYWAESLEEVETLVSGLKPTFAATNKFETNEGHNITVKKVYYNRRRPG